MIMNRIWRQTHSYRIFPVESENHCFQAEIWSDHRQISHFQNGRHNVYFIAHINCPNSRWPPKLTTNRVFDHSSNHANRSR